MKIKNDKWVDKTKRIKIDKNGYERGQIKHSDLVHRQIAYKYLYRKNRRKYPKPFSEYVVHHIDGNKKNNDISNLQILTPEEHEKIHGIIKDKQEKDLFSFEEKARERESKMINPIFPFDLENSRKRNILEWEKKTPKRLRDKLIKELRKSERRKQKEAKEEAQKREKERLERYEQKRKEFEEKNKIEKRRKIIIYFIIGIILILFYLLIFNQEDNKYNIQNTTLSQENSLTIPEQPKIEPILVSGSKTNVIIKNNLEREVSLSVTYRIYSKWFGKDSTETQVFDVGAKNEKSFQVYFNDGCVTAPCSVSIINFEEV